MLGRTAVPFYVTGVLTAIRDDDQKLIGFANIIRDATEGRDAQEKLVEAREQLAMAQKMEAIGKLTGGIAHDFNNLLMIIGGNVETFRRLLDPKLPRALEAIQTAAKRGESLTRQLLTFSRSQHLSPRVLDLTASITNMRTLIESSLRGNIVYNEKIDPDIWPVKVDLAELELAIVNIAVNARDAMPNGGVFTLTAGNVKAHDERLTEPQSGDFVAVECNDTGMGIPPTLLSKIFDPFFTTKEVGKGTGLGLSQVYGFAHQAGGWVRAESKVGHGTTISGLFAAHVLTRTSREEEISAIEATHSQRPVALVVDDSVEVAEVTSSLFEHLGYDTVGRRCPPRPPCRYWKDRAHRPASDCRARPRPSHPICGSACALCPRRGGSCSRRSSHRSSSSSARPCPSGHSWRAADSHPSGVLPALIVSFSSFVLRCLGTDTIVASIIWPPRAI